MNKFKSGWRPAIGWVCVAGLALHFLAFPSLSMALQVVGAPALVSPLDAASLMSLVVTLLGLGGLRTGEKIKGAENGSA